MLTFVALMRRYVVEFLDCRNREVSKELMEPDYALHMSGIQIGPRDEVFVAGIPRALHDRASAHRLHRRTPGDSVLLAWCVHSARRSSGSLVWRRPTPLEWAKAYLESGD
jgi:hypothetical protein